MATTLDRPTSQQGERPLVERLDYWLDLPLALLAVTFVALLVAELAFALAEPWSTIVRSAELAIWGVFLAAFILEMALATSKWRYLRENWLVAVSLALPALRVFRIFRALRVLRSARALRSLNLARVVGAANRATGVLREFARVSQFLYLALLTLVITPLAAAIGYSFERGVEGADLTSYGEALWWAATLVTTVNAQSEAVTLEGRIIALLLRVFGMAIIGYLTARIAVFFLGRGARGEEEAVARELESLRGQIARLEQHLETMPSPRPRDQSAPRAR